MGKWRFLLVFGAVLAVGGCEGKTEPDRGNNGFVSGEAGLETEILSSSEDMEQRDGEVWGNGEAGDSFPDGNSGADSLGGIADGEADMALKDVPEGTEVVQGGPFGRITITLPADWKYETCPVEGDEVLGGDYGIRFSPESVTEGYIELVYVERFGVCGTGLETEKKTIGDCPVNIGTYDGHQYWDFIHFQGPYEGIVARTCLVESWWEEYEEEVLDILNTLSFEPDVREGGIYVYDKESENDQIGLYFSLKRVTSTGVALVYDQYDPEAPTGELLDGDDFTLEVKTGSQWEAVPITLKGDYGFHDIAYEIPRGGITERELNWEWLYGELEPGEYRIWKRIHDFRKAGEFDEYEICARFLLH